MTLFNTSTNWRYYYDFIANQLGVRELKLFFKVHLKPKLLTITGVDFLDLIHWWGDKGTTLSGTPFDLRITTPDSFF